MSRDSITDFNKVAARVDYKVKAHPEALPGKPTINLKGPTLFCVKCKVDRPTKGCTKVKGTALMICAECKAK